MTPPEFDLSEPVFSPLPPASTLTVRPRLFGFAIYMVLFSLSPVVFIPLVPVLRYLLPKSLTTANALLYYIVVVFSCVIALIYVAAKQPTHTTLREVWLSVLGDRKKHWVNLSLGIGLYVPVFVCVAIAVFASSRLFEIVPHPALKEFHNANRFNQGLLLLQAVVFAPIIEETMFRGLLFTALRDLWGKGAAILVSGFVFAAVHPGLPGALLPLWTLGIALAMVYSWRRSLVVCIVLHMTFNAVTFIAQFYQ